jgi:protein-S-isoprenylcysteine O-methyltransferase Ste14
MEPSQNIAVRASYLVYGLASYALFFVTFLYMTAFVGDFWQVLGLTGPAFRGMNGDGTPLPLVRALLIDGLLIGVFALQHSGMARTGFKTWWTRIVPPACERSTYVLAASLCLDLLFWQWQPLATSELWHASGPLAIGLVALSFIGWGIVLASTFMIDHYDLFGLRQVWLAFRNRPYPEHEFATPGLYRAVRHPIYLGFVVALWATPIMTLGHAVFAIGTTAYILFAIQLEERDLVRRYGELYVRYRGRVSMLLPLPRRAAESRASAVSSTQAGTPATTPPR